MAENCNETGFFFENMKHFPPVINGRINIAEFLEASSDLVCLVDRLGTVFAPVKFDMQGNIEKIRKYFKCDKNSCLLELMIEEASNGKNTASEGVLWLNRALLFFELVFGEIIEHLKSNNHDVNMKKVFTVAYEGSVKKYHNWVTQQIFTLICKMCPTFLQILKSFEADNNIKAFEEKLTSLNITLHLVRCKIDDFIKDHNLLSDAE